MPNSIYFYKGICWYFIPVRIIVPCTNGISQHFLNLFAISWTTMLFLYLHFSATAKVPRLNLINYESYNLQVLWPTDLNGTKNFITFWFNLVCHMTKTMLQTFCHVILLPYFSVSEPIPNLSYHSPLPLLLLYLYIENRSPYKVLKWKYM